MHTVLLFNNTELCFKAILAFENAPGHIGHRAQPL